MRPIEQIQATNEQANGPGVWETPKPKPASEHVALQASLREFGLSEDDVQVFGFPFFGR